MDQVNNEECYFSMSICIHAHTLTTHIHTYTPSLTIFALSEYTYTYNDDLRSRRALSSSPTHARSCVKTNHH